MKSWVLIEMWGDRGRETGDEETRDGSVSPLSEKGDEGRFCVSIV